MLGAHAMTQSVAVRVDIAALLRDGSTAEALIRSAHAAMYSAKQSKSGYASAGSSN